MDLEQQKTLRALRDELVHIEEALSRWQQLGEKREMLSEYMLSLSEHSELFDTCQKKLRNIDHQMDEIEDYTPDHIQKKWDLLISEILRLQPHSAGDYKELKDTIAKNQRLWENWLQVKNLMFEVQKHLEALVLERNKIKGSGLFRYIFGVNPNVMISQHLQQANQLAVEEMKSIERIADEMSGFQELDNAYKEFREILFEIKVSSPKRWSFKSIDTTYAKLLRNLKELLKQVDHYRDSLKEQLQESEEKARRWINDALTH